MNPTLLRAVRQRMAQQSTEQLLDIWVTNDRATWSAEAFEAVNAILAERGRSELPPQNDPAPIANRFNRTSPEAQYWLGWLRPILWVAMAPAALRLAEAPDTVGALVHAIAAPLTTALTPMDLMVPTLNDLIVPAWLIVASIACLRLKPWGRTMLLLYPLPVLALAAWTLYESYRSFIEFGGIGAWPVVGLFRTLLETLLRALVVPGILNVLLRRPEISALFVRQVSGFSVESTTEPAL